jgi:hypothetical protein
MLTCWNVCLSANVAWRKCEIVGMWERVNAGMLQSWNAVCVNVDMCKMLE